MPTFPQYISGKTVVNSPFSASADRYSFLSLENAEPNLGAPSGPGGFYVLISDPISGVRLWSNLTSLTSEPFAGDDTQIIFNSGGKLVGSPYLTFNYNLTSVVAGGNNCNVYCNTFTFGQNITSTAPNFTYVNNLSTPGYIYGQAGQFNQLFATVGNSGFGTLTPNEKVTIVGNLSVTDTIYGRVSAVPLEVRIAEDTQVIFNSGGRLNGLSAFIFNYNLSALKVGGNQCITPGSLYSNILGGCGNVAMGNYTSVTVGQSNSARGDYSVVVGGCNNISCGVYSFVGGGFSNNIFNNNSVIGGGQANCVLGVQGTIAGGRQNIINSDYSIIGGGFGNCIADTYASIVGGDNNVINTGGVWAFVGGGSNNYNTGSYSVIAGGFSNEVSSGCAGILGGRLNCVQHVNSFIIGSNLKSTATCTTFVNNLSTPGSVCSFAVDTNILLVKNIQVASATINPTATATDAFITVTVGGSSLALPLFRL